MSYFTGPYLRIYAPEFSLEQRKIMATELTDAIADALCLDSRCRDTIKIHFCSCQVDSIAVGGRLLSETEEPYYHLEFCGRSLNQECKVALGRCLMPLMQELLGVPASEAERISLIFQEVPPGDLLIGNRRLSEHAQVSG